MRNMARMPPTHRIDLIGLDTENELALITGI
jgi:hypothetical protein